MLFEGINASTFPDDNLDSELYMNSSMSDISKKQDKFSDAFVSKMDNAMKEIILDDNIEEISDSFRENELTNISSSSSNILANIGEVEGKNINIYFHLNSINQNSDLQWKYFYNAFKEIKDVNLFN